ncbi:TBC1 domain family member 23 isoform X1 [Thrips palmi]|uniref:TBC1 domain family member 23 n=2 Tax=Thrips palmi TaxID=161013 RepID=A0A6P8YRM0_THRPL|nr:TBC1 domain family member 23 isoform X1 [Thrips palmi]XP_034242668.1 TBC1 domain family member 23 isoform X1 [Thrips palmi]
MAKSSDDEQEWMDDLEASLLMIDAQTSSDVLRICKGKPINESLRPLAWQKCLDVSHSSYNAPLSEIFDLPEQKLLRHDCQQFVAKLGNEDEDKVSVMSDLETILTTYRKIRNINYESGNGWLELLLPLLALKKPQNETYALFTALRTQYIPNGCAHKSGDPFHLFRLLLLYHDPELCSFLDTKKITPDLYCRSWFQTLFAANCNLTVVQAMWDVYFQQSEPFYLFFLSLVMIINAKEQIMGLETGSRDELVEMLTNMPSQLEHDDVPDFCGLAHYYGLKTPSSFRKDLRYKMFGDEGFHNFMHEGIKNSSSSMTLTSPMDEKDPSLPQGISQALCLPVCAAELVDSVSSSASGAPLTNQENELIVETVRFFLVDCRPAEQYNSGHLPTAFHLDSNLMLQEPAAFATAVQGLLTARRQAQAAGSAAAGDHLCFLGSGRNEEDQYTHMVVSSFLQKHTLHVSMLTGGFEAIHEYLGETLSENLEHHNLSSCLVCKSNSTSQIESPPAQTPTVDIFSKLSAAVSKLKTSEVKGKLLDYIVNPSGSSAKPPVERHVRANDKLGRRYRNVAPVFSIDDDQEFDSSNVPANDDEATDEESKREIVNINQWSKENNVTATFPCQEFKVNNMFFDSILALSESFMYVLRLVPGRKGHAQVVARRSLSSVVKITSRRKHPNMITFKYGVSQDDDLVISDMDRLLIPNSTEAMKTVTKQIVNFLKTQDE